METIHACEGCSGVSSSNLSLECQHSICQKCCDQQMQWIPKVRSQGYVICLGCGTKSYLSKIPNQNLISDSSQQLQFQNEFQLHLDISTKSLDLFEEDLNQNQSLSGSLLLNSPSRIPLKSPKDKQFNIYSARHSVCHDIQSRGSIIHEVPEEQLSTHSLYTPPPTPSPHPYPPPASLPPYPLTLRWIIPSLPPHPSLQTHPQACTDQINAQTFPPRCTE